jgi:integrase
MAADRPRSKLNHHLFLRHGIWWTRFERNGRAVRKSTGCPKSEVASARTIRNALVARNAKARSGIEELPEAVSIEKLLDLYLAEQSQPYDRRRGGVQPGTKKDSEADRVIVERLRRAGLDFGLRADLLDTERIFDLGVSLEEMGLAGLTRRNTLRFLRCVFGWARRERNRRKTGVVTNPFDDLDPADRPRLFPSEIAGNAPPLTRAQLRAVYDLLPAHVHRPVKFAAHCGMRWGSELLRMTWGRVDFERRVCTTTPWAKRGKVRDVPLSDVALAILRKIRPENPSADDPVWLGSSGKPLRDARKAYHRAVEKVCPAARPGSRLPDFHSLRRTCASALALIAPTAVVGAVLGHSKKKSVTDTYITVPIEEQIAALNRSALLIDGEAKENVIDFPGTAQKAAVGA